VPRPPRNKIEPSLRVRALQMLARREHTRHELERKLAPHAESEAEVGRLLDEFANCGWLSEQRAVEQVVHARRGKFGSRRIRQELVKRGVDAERMASAMGDLKAGERAALRTVWRRKFGAAPRNRAERARQIRFLQGRGFELDMILKVIDIPDADDEIG
jgi:regulatory protein